ncbi:hypothetical protein NDU88_002184 [Pleurodeles waltl]|uniref:Uncharacterized protein n=1 Tax=Pleurodeles waltl TaxID=8319 RepID=A0AAV7WNQ3_PLEWA|nr:hypothetical protein NDU88_002184 [Pleurodeles waltl]
MLGSRSSAKISAKPARQLLFSEALLHSKTSSPSWVAQQPARNHTMSDTAQESTMDRILQEISAVGRKLEGMDNTMASLTAETKSIRLDITGFQSHMMGLEQRVSMVEAQAATSWDWDQELLYLRSKLTGLEDRSRRDNARFLGFSEAIGGEDMYSFLRETLPKVTGIKFDLPLEFQRAPRLGPKRPDATVRPQPSIACLLYHMQARQLIQRARTYEPCQMDCQEIRISADFSKKTSECRRVFLAPRPRLCQMEVKYDLFQLARMWVMKNGVSQYFYDPEGLQSFLDDLLPMDTSAPIPPRGSLATDQKAQPHGPAPGSDRHSTASHPRGRDLERLMNSHDDRGQVLHAVALHTQVADRDRSCSPLKPPVDTY